MKKLLAMIIVLALSLSLFACGDPDENQGGNPPQLPSVPNGDVEMPTYPIPGEWN